MHRLAIPVAPDQGVGGAVVGELGLGVGLELGDDPLGQDLAELDSPLVEGVDAPDGALGEDAVLVKRHQRAERPRREPLGENRVRGPVALEDAVRDQVLRRALLAHLVGRLAEGERLGLGEDVGHQQIVVLAQRVERAAEADEVAGDQLRSLVDQLVEGVLAVGPGLAPPDGPGLVVHRARRRASRACRSTPSSAAGDRPGSGAGTGRRAGRRSSGRRRSPRTRPRAAPAAPAGCARAAPRGSARPWRGSRRASRANRSGPIASMVESPIAESIE